VSGARNTTGARRDLPSTVLVSVAVAGAVAIGIVHVLTHHPFHDECLHVHKLWLMSDGLTPHRDFWCNYPVLGYVLTLPFLEVFPTAARNLLALRFLMLGLLIAAGCLMAVHGRRTTGPWIWGVAPVALLPVALPVGRFLAEYSIDPFAMLAAVGAIVLFFTRPRPLRVGAAAALSLLSVLLTPKYALPLGFGLAGYLVSAVVAGPRRTASLLAFGIGAGAAALLVLGLYGIGGVSPVENVRYAHLFMAEFKLAADPEPVTLFSATLGILFRNLPLLALVVAGLVGFRRWVKGRLVARGLGPFGILLGAATSAVVTKTYMVQYIVPLLVCLAAFAPFTVRLATTEPAARRLGLLLGVVMLATVGVGLPRVMVEFHETPANVRDGRGIVADQGLRMGPPAVESLKVTQALLDRIPPDGLVAASPQFHPLFRRDLTFVTADERPSFGGLLDAEDPARAFFDPDHLRRRLEEAPPAYVCLTALEFNYPPGWRAILADYLRRNADRYVPYPAYPDAYLRGW